MIREGKETYPNKAAQVKHERAEPARVERREKEPKVSVTVRGHYPPPKRVKTGY